MTIKDLQPTIVWNNFYGLTQCPRPSKHEEAAREFILNWAKERGIDLTTGAEAYGNHVDIMGDFDLVVLAPQAASYFDDLKKDCDRMGLKCCSCRGKQYIDLSRDGEAALKFVIEQLQA